MQVFCHLQNKSYKSVAKPLQNYKLVDKPKTSKCKTDANWGSRYYCLYGFHFVACNLTRRSHEARRQWQWSSAMIANSNNIFVGGLGPTWENADICRRRATIYQRLKRMRVCQPKPAPNNIMHRATTVTTNTSLPRLPQSYIFTIGPRMVSIYIF